MFLDFLIQNDKALLDYFYECGLLKIFEFIQNFRREAPLNP